MQEDQFQQFSFPYITGISYLSFCIYICVIMDVIVVVIKNTKYIYLGVFLCPFILPIWKKLDLLFLFLH